MRVLVIEDDDKIASFIVNGLKQAGFATEHSANGEDGLHLASTHHYDAAIVDLMLPRLDPCEQFRKSERLDHVVLAAGLQAFNPIVYKALGALNEQWCIDFLPPRRFDDGEGGHAR